MSDYGFYKDFTKFREEVLTALITVNENVQRLRQEIAEAQGNPQEIADMAAALRSKTDELAAALASFPGQESEVQSNRSE